MPGPGLRPMTAASSLPKALVLCEGGFATPSGKTANGLVRYCERFRLAGVIDSRHAGKDAGAVLDAKPNGIPVFSSLEEALKAAPDANVLLMGLAPDGGMLPPEYEAVFLEAAKRGLDLECGLHDFLADRPAIVEAASRSGATVRDVRRSPPEKDLHFFTGKIDEVDAFVVACLGTDSAIGKRTTARILTVALNAAGHRAVFVGTGQTAYLQGAKYSIMLDAIVNDFVTGEIEHVVHEAWRNERPDFIVLEGQGSLTHPAYPGGFELLAAGRPKAIVLQHAPARRHLDGFPQYPMPELAREIGILQLLSGRKVVAVTINHEDLDDEAKKRFASDVKAAYGIPAVDPLTDDMTAVVGALLAERQRLQAQAPTARPG